jgi:Flp pilus assembly pilin Flp
MLRLFRNKKAQSTAEYAILIGLVVAAVVGMQTYVKRGIQGRVKDAGDAHTKGIADADWSNISQTPATMLNQYESEGLSARSTSTTVAGSKDTSSLDKGGKVTRTTDQTTRQAEGDYQEQRFGPPGNQNPPG